MEIRRSADRGHANHGWLDSYHSFSFADYYDANRMAYSALRVINEDVIAPAKGFGMHSHKDMEIITYVLKGELTHKDSLGNTETIKQGCVQRMTAGTGVTHSEFNASLTNPVHLIQIWITPNVQNLAPSYEDKYFDDASKCNQWCLLASENSKTHLIENQLIENQLIENQSLIVHQDIALYASQLNEHKSLTYDLKPNRCAYLQICSGQISINEQVLSAGDAAVFDDSQLIKLTALNHAEILLFDLPQD